MFTRRNKWCSSPEADVNAPSAADAARLRELLDAYYRAIQLPMSDALDRECLEILEEIHTMMHQRRIPRHADDGLCGEGLVMLYQRLGLWDRFVAWGGRVRDLEEDVGRRVSTTRIMLRLAEARLHDSALAARLFQDMVDMDLEPGASPHDRAQLLRKKIEVAGDIWRSTQGGQYLDQAIRWAEQARELDPSSMDPAMLEGLRQLRRDHHGGDG